MGVGVEHERPLSVSTTEDNNSLYPLCHQLPTAPKEGTHKLLSPGSS